APSPQGGHPLASRLADTYRERALAGPILEVAAGSGRNTRTLLALGLQVVSTRDDEPITQLPGGRNSYAAALSTHGYLHGTIAKLRAGLAELHRVLRTGAPIAITLGSIADARFGFGTALDDNTFAPGDGDEAGIPHTYFDRDGVLELVPGLFVIESLEDVDVDAIVGRWAHNAKIGMRHWFVVARKAQVG
ncbi:MAG: class I SAM-dependent methyltransferase, partial [Candidatus Velthaea sp.]